MGGTLLLISTSLLLAFSIHEKFNPEVPSGTGSCMLIEHPKPSNKIGTIQKNLT